MAKSNTLDAAALSLIYPNGFSCVENHPFQYAALIGTEVALQSFDFEGSEVDVSFCDESASLTLPALDALGGRLVDFSAVVLVVDGALAYAASQHVIFVGCFIGKTRLALSGRLSSGWATILIFYIQRRTSFEYIAYNFIYYIQSAIAKLSAIHISP